VGAGEALRLAPTLTPEAADLLRKMTARAPGDRPAVDQVFKAMSDEAMFTVGGRPSSPKPTKGRLVTNMTSSPPGATPGTPATPPPPAPRPGGSRIITNLRKS
jgi:hypothetical protein